MITGNPPGRARAVVPSPRKRRAQRAGQNLARHGQVPQIESGGVNVAKTGRFENRRAIS